MNRRIFAAMPFGVKEGIDFDAVYNDLIRPALEGFDVFRADDEMRAGNIRADMFQELLMADLVVADLSIGNPNVWYELGVRHGLRAGGVVMIRCGNMPSPFDTYTDRKLTYRVAERAGVSAPDPLHLDADRKALAAMVRQTLSASPTRVVSPVYHHLPYLKEPEWRRFLITEKGEFQERFEAWDRILQSAQRKNRPGDILVLAGEAPVSALAVEAMTRAAKALFGLCRYSYALEQAEEVLKLSPNPLEAGRIKGMALGRLGKLGDAETWLKKVSENHPGDAETLALLGRVEKDAWKARFDGPDLTVPERIARAGDAVGEARLNEAIAAYTKGFRIDPAHYYSAINALSLHFLKGHVTGTPGDAGERKAMEGGLRWALHGAISKNPKDYWAKVTLADLEFLTSETDKVLKAYGNALALADGNRFAVESPLQQLRLFRDLGFRPELTGAVIGLFEKELEHMPAPSREGRVFLFSGHMIDAPGRAVPRFPAGKEQAAKIEINRILDSLNAGPDDTGLCGGACGGDLIFAEACLDPGRSMGLEVRIPFKEPEFLEASVTFAGESWRERYHDVIRHPSTRLFVMPGELGETPRNVNPFARNNLWQLYTAMAMGAENLHFICLWDGKAGDGEGGTKHMHDEVEKRAGLSHIHVIDVKGLTY
jgi:tetratricopeptide (TPR) repeat protein